MKSLSNYTEEKQTELFLSTGAFFAFSNKQLAEKKQVNVKYVSVGLGLFVPKENAKSLIDGLESINDEGIKQDMAENGKDKIIRRELFNYECFYTGDVSDCVEALSEYGITREEIEAQYRHILNTENVDM